MTYSHGGEPFFRTRKTQNCRRETLNYRRETLNYRRETLNYRRNRIIFRGDSVTARKEICCATPVTLSSHRRSTIVAQVWHNRFTDVARQKSLRENNKSLGAETMLPRIYCALAHSGFRRCRDRFEPRCSPTFAALQAHTGACGQHYSLTDRVPSGSSSIVTRTTSSGRMSSMSSGHSMKHGQPL